MITLFDTLAELVAGFYDWRGQHIVPTPPATIAYDRFDWRDLEPSQGVYDFSKIEAAVSAADAKGQRFAFRIRCVHQVPPTDSKRYGPDYIYPDAAAVIPDWNSAAFLMGMLKFLFALSEVYDGDPRVAWIEIGMMGAWGEWSDLSAATDETLKLVVDFHLWTFTNTQLVMMAKTRACAVVQALSDPQVGWRVDGLGKAGYYDFDTNPNYAAAWPLMKDRWMTAPVIAEFTANSFDAVIAFQDVMKFHVRLVGNGNILAWDKQTVAQQTAFFAMAYVTEHGLNR